MPNTRAKARNYPCGECGIGVKYSSILCTGTCNLWYHGGCVNLTERQVTKLTKKEISNWKCRNCNISPPSPTKTLLDSNQVMNNLPILDNPKSTTILHIELVPLSGAEEVFQGTGEEHFQPNIKEKLCCSTPKTPALAKIRKEGESIEEFFNTLMSTRTVLTFINVKKYGKPPALCETATSYMPYQSPTQPGPQTQTSSQDATHQLDTFLDKTKIKFTRT
ncbi:hypothetical protein J6590_040311 [Homalodisca vitripennis]|nr:hypothetical protein J6590_040311 [Homalodisca vitripennis]